MILSILRLVTTEFDSLLDVDLPVRIELLSKYDCINSHHSEGGMYEMDSYFGDCVNALRLNPGNVAKLLRSKGYSASGYWPKLSDKLALVSPEAFLIEDESRICGAASLVFVGIANLRNLLRYKTDNPIITIPKGNNVGFFSSTFGGGSCLESPLVQDFTIDLSIPWGLTKYDRYRMVIDSACDRYSISSVYGVTRAFWGSRIKFDARPSDSCRA